MVKAVWWFILKYQILAVWSRIFSSTASVCFNKNRKSLICSQATNYHDFLFRINLYRRRFKMHWIVLCKLRNARSNQLYDDIFIRKIVEAYVYRCSQLSCQLTSDGQTTVALIVSGDPITCHARVCADIRPVHGRNKVGKPVEADGAVTCGNSRCSFSPGHLWSGVTVGNTRQVGSGAFLRDTGAGNRDFWVICYHIKPCWIETLTTHVNYDKLI